MILGAHANPRKVACTAKHIGHQRGQKFQLTQTEILLGWIWRGPRDDHNLELWSQKGWNMSEKLNEEDEGL